MEQGLIDRNRHSIGRKQRLKTSWAPGISSLHQAFEHWILQKSPEPVAQRGQVGISVEVLWIGHPPLADKGPESAVGESHAGSAQPALGRNPFTPSPQDGLSGRMVRLALLSWIAVGVLEAIQIFLFLNCFFNLKLILSFFFE